MTQHQIVWDQIRPIWWTMLPTNAVFVRLVAVSGSECEVSPPRSQQLERRRHQFLREVNADRCELQQSAWSPLPKPLVVDSGAGETVMPIDWLTYHLLTESGGSRANDFCTTADGSKVYNEGQAKLDVCTLDSQQRRSMTFAGCQ